MQLGFVSAILPELSLEDVLTFAAEEDYDCVEVMCWPKGKDTRRYAGVTHINAAEFSKSDAKNVRELSETFGVEISGLGYYPNPLAQNKTEAKVYRDHIKKVIHAAAMLEINQMNTFIGRDWTKSVDDNWKEFKKTWPSIIKYAEKQGVRVAIENCPM